MPSNTDAVRPGPTQGPEGPTSAAPVARLDPPPSRRPREEPAASEPARAPARPARPVQLPEFPGFKLLFQLDEDTNEIVVRVIDPNDGSVIRTIPPEDVVGVLRQLRDGPGALLDEEA